MAHHTTASGTADIHGNVIDLQCLAFWCLHAEADIAARIVILSLRPLFTDNHITLGLAIGIVCRALGPGRSVSLQGSVVLDHHTAPLFIEYSHTAFCIALVIRCQRPERTERCTGP